MTGTRKTHRFARAALLLTAVLFVCASVCFPAAEAGHACTGENCPVCLQLSLCRRTAEAALCVVSALLPAALLLSGAQGAVSAFPRRLLRVTPVSLCVKLSD